jgi:arginase
LLRLAFATGRGPDIVCDLEGRRPLVRDVDVAVFACRAALASGRAVGLQVAIYNPDIDSNGSNGRGLAATVRQALAG